MKKRMQNYKTGNFNYKPIAYLPLDFSNGKDIEDCVKSMYKQHIIKLKTDIKFNKKCFFIKFIKVREYEFVIQILFLNLQYVI
jgi:hypothetical protein